MPEFLEHPGIEGDPMQPALKAATTALTDALRAADIADATFVLVVVQPSDHPDKCIVRMAANTSPEHAHELLSELSGPPTRAQQEALRQDILTKLRAMRERQATMTLGDFEPKKGH